MHRTCKDAAEDYPQIGRRTELRTHDGTKDRAGTGNVQKLNHKNLPTRKHHVVKTVGLCNGGSHTVVGTENTLYEAAIEHITQNESNKAQSK